MSTVYVPKQITIIGTLSLSRPLESREEAQAILDGRGLSGDPNAFLAEIHVCDQPGCKKITPKDFCKKHAISRGDRIR